MNIFLIVSLTLSMLIFSCGKKDSSNNFTNESTSGTFNQVQSSRTNCLNSGLYNVWNKTTSSCVHMSTLWFDGSIKHFTSINSISYFEFNQIHTQALFELKVDDQFPQDIIVTARLNEGYAKFVTRAGYEHEFSINAHSKDLFITSLKNLYLYSQGDL